MYKQDKHSNQNSRNHFLIKIFRDMNNKSETEQNQKIIKASSLLGYTSNTTIKYIKTNLVDKTKQITTTLG